MDNMMNGEKMKTTRIGKIEYNFWRDEGNAYVEFSSFGDSDAGIISQIAYARLTSVYRWKGYIHPSQLTKEINTTKDVLISEINSAIHEAIAEYKEWRHHGVIHFEF